MDIDDLLRVKMPRVSFKSKDLMDNCEPPLDVNMYLKSLFGLVNSYIEKQDENKTEFGGLDHLLLEDMFMHT